MDIRQELRTFLKTDPIYKGLLPAEFADDFPLIRSGALDSIGIFNLVSFLEKKYGISVEPQDLNESHFGNIGAIEAFIRSRRS